MMLRVRRLRQLKSSSDSAGCGGVYEPPVSRELKT